MTDSKEIEDLEEIEEIEEIKEFEAIKEIEEIEEIEDLEDIEDIIKAIYKSDNDFKDMYKIIIPELNNFIYYISLKVQFAYEDELLRIKCCIDVYDSKCEIIEITTISYDDNTKMSDDDIIKFKHNHKLNINKIVNLIKDVKETNVLNLKTKEELSEDIVALIDELLIYPDSGFSMPYFIKLLSKYDELNEYKLYTEIMYNNLNNIFYI